MSDLMDRLTYNAPANGDSDRFEAAREIESIMAQLAQANAKLHEIGDYAHEYSTGPTVPDHLWTVREMAYGALGATDSAAAQEDVAP